jgi:Tfp pilus assembly protein FimV
MMDKPMRFARVAGGLALLLAFGPGASGQSLGEAARKEKDRREKAGPTGPAFTDEDLRGYAEGATGPTKPAAGEKASTDKAKKEAPAPGEGGAGDEAYWRARAKAARAAIAAAEARVAKAEAALRDAPAAGIRQPQPGDAVAQVPPPVVTDADQRGAEAALAAARSELERAKKAGNDLEEEARRKGALPGWLR